MSNEFEINNVKYSVKEPSLRIETEAQKVYNKQINKSLIDEKLILKDQMDTFLKERGLWDSEKEMMISSRREEIERKLKLLEKKGIKISEAIKLAKEVSALRFEVFALNSYKNQYNFLTADHHADAAKFSYLLCECLVYNDTGKRVFNSYEEMLDSNNKELFDKASEIMSNIVYGDVSEYIKDLPESKFLEKYKKYDPDAVEKPVETEEVEDTKFLDDEGNPIDE